MEAEQQAPRVADVVKPGVTFRRNSAAGIYISRVIRRHRDAGYWETTIIEGGHPALLNAVQIVSTRDIYAARAGRPATA